MTRFERQQLETRRHDSKMIKYFAVLCVVGVTVAIIELVW